MKEFILNNFVSIGLTVSGLLFISIIAIVYLQKKKYSSLESKLYKALLVTTIILLLLEIVCVYTISIRSIYPFLNEVLCRIYILGDIIWFTMVLIYMQILLTDKKYNNFKEILSEKPIIFTIILAITMFMISCLFSLKFTSGMSNEINVIGGNGVKVLYIIYVVIWVYMMKLIFTNISKKNIVKRIPILTFLALYLIFGIIQLLYDDFNDLTFVFSFCIVCMYFTIENQDLKLVSELETAKKEAEIADKDKTEFLSKMSHEIRTPMNVIMGYSEVLMDEKKSTTTDVKKDAENIYNAAKSLLEIINNILTFSRIESGKEKIDEVEYSILDVIGELESFAHSKIDPQKVSFNIKYDSNLPANYYGDKLKVYRAILNIINNSIKYTTRGSIDVIFKFLPKDNNQGSIIVEIKDTGYGIKQDSLALIKEDIEENTDDGNLTSTGLGLILTKKIINMLNGQMKIESEYGAGTTIRISVDQKVIGDIKAIDIVKNKEEDNSIYFDCSKYRILVVDDNKLNRIVIERLLKPYNIKCELLDSGAECISKIKAGEKYDLILLDHLMPELDGIETLRVLKKLQIEDLPPAIAVTANLVTELKEMYLKEGFSGYLAKPVDVRDLNNLMIKYFK